MSDGIDVSGEERLSSAAILADQPDSDDKLEFRPYANTIRDIILAPNTSTPLTIGIFGSWGSGKTSLMRMIESGLREANLDSSASAQHQSIWFNAWLYSKEQVLWRALIMQVLNGIRELRAGDTAVRDQLDRLAEQLYRTTGPSELGTLSIAASDLLHDQGTEAAQLSLRMQHALDFLENMASARQKGELAAVQALRTEVRRAMADLEQERIESLETFQRQFKQLVREHVLPFGYLIIFIDDLDRCLPEKAVEVLEALKLFLDVEGCIFILGIDRQVIERGIKLRYRELVENNDPAGGLLEELIDGRKYLEKIIQIPFALPPIGPDAMGRYIAAIAPDLPHPECGTVFAQTLEPNPRQVKRAINIFSLLWNLSRNKAELASSIAPVRLAKLVVLQQRFPDQYTELRIRPELLIGWENQARRLEATAETPIHPLPVDLSVDDDRALRMLLTMHALDGPENVENSFSGLTADDIYTYVYLTRTIKESQEPTTAAAPSLQKDVAAILPEEEAAGERVVTLRSGEAERRSYAEATFLGDVDDHGRSNPDVNAGEQLLEELARSGSGFYQQVFPDGIQRTAFAAQLIEPSVIRLQGRSGDFQVPWELVYDGELDGFSYVKQYAQKAPLLADQPRAVLDGFWGFKHIIERRITRPTSTDPLMRLENGRVTVCLTIARGVPGAEEVAGLFNDLERDGAIQLRRADQPEMLRKHLMDTSVDLFVLHTYAGTDSSESWFTLTGEGETPVNRRTLVDVLGREFTSGDLRELSGELEIEAEAVYGATLREQATNLVSYLYRRGRLEELERLIGDRRPDIDLSVNSVRLTRQEVESWRIRHPGNALLVANVTAGIGRANDWTGWLDLLAKMGISGVVAPMAAVSPHWTPAFLRVYMDAFLAGRAAGDALRAARRTFYEQTRNPLGLLLAHFGPAEQRLLIEG